MQDQSFQSLTLVARCRWLCSRCAREIMEMITRWDFRWWKCGMKYKAIRRCESYENSFLLSLNTCGTKWILFEFAQWQAIINAVKVSECREMKDHVMQKPIISEYALSWLLTPLRIGRKLQRISLWRKLQQSIRIFHHAKSHFPKRSSSPRTRYFSWNLREIFNRVTELDVYVYGAGVFWSKQSMD